MSVVWRGKWLSAVRFGTDEMVPVLPSIRIDGIWYHSVDL